MTYLSYPSITGADSAFAASGAALLGTRIQHPGTGAAGAASLPAAGGGARAVQLSLHQALQAG